MLSRRDSLPKYEILMNVLLVVQKLGFHINLYSSAKFFITLSLRRLFCSTVTLLSPKLSPGSPNIICKSSSSSSSYSCGRRMPCIDMMYRHRLRERLYYRQNSITHTSLHVTHHRSPNIDQDIPHHARKSDHRLEKRYRNVEKPQNL